MGSQTKATSIPSGYHWQSDIMNYLKEMGSLVKYAKEQITNISIGTGENDIEVAKDLILLLQQRYGLEEPKESIDIRNFTNGLYAKRDE